MHTALIGASRGIGRVAALDLLRSGESVSLLLRSPEAIESDPDFSQPLKEGRVRIVKGDAYDVKDLVMLLDHPGIDSVVSSLGAVYPNGKRPFSITKGLLLPSPEVCTRATISLLHAIQELIQQGRKAPAVVAISVTGVGSSYKHLPYLYQLILPWLLQQTISDKKGLESALSRASTSLASDPDEPPSAVWATSSLEAIQPGILDEILIVRPARLEDTDGNGILRAGEGITTHSTGRAELGKWIASALRDRPTWMNRRVTVGF